MIALRAMICATGLTNPARAALRYSFSMAEQFHCALEVVHVCESPEVSGEAGASGTERMARAISAHALRERLDMVVRALPTGGAGRATTHLLDGDTSEAVLAFAERRRAGLVVLGSRPGSDATGGSIAEKLVERMSGVLTVPSREPALAPRVKRLLLVLEPGRGNELLLDWTVFLADHFRATVQLISCASPRAGALEAAHRLQHEVEERLRRAQIRLDASCIEQRSLLAETVLARAERDGCDLIAMGTALTDDAGRNVLSAVRRASTLPVLSVRDVPQPRMFVDINKERALWPKEVSTG